MKTEQWTKQ